MGKISRLVTAATAAIVAGGCAWYVSGQIGFERGDSVAQWEAHFDAARNRATMKQIGACKWAELAAGCSFKDATQGIPTP